MKKQIILLSIILIAAFSTYAQNTPEQNLLNQANDMGEKFIAKDYKGFLKYTHPATIKTMGGDKAMLAEVTKSFQEFERDGIKILGITFGVPAKILSVNNELQCTLPQSIEMHIPTGKVTAISTLLAISEDQGKNWFFLDTGSNDLMTMQLLLPQLSDELVIPPPSDPIFEEELKTE